MGLFEILPADGSAISVPEICNKTGAEDQLVLRIMRLLGAYYVLDQSNANDGSLEFAHTPYSRLLVTPHVKALSLHVFDMMLQAHVLSAGSYYKQNGFREPQDPRNTGYSFAHGVKDATWIEILETMPDQLKQNEDGVALVDVGGGKGHILEVIRDVYPSLKAKGKLALEDLKVVFDGGILVDEKEVLVQTYDFFAGTQPIKGMILILVVIRKDN